MRKIALTGMMVLMGALAGGQPRPAEAALATTCKDDAWAGYNDCLVSSGGELGKKLCDLEFLIRIAECMKPKA